MNIVCLSLLILHTDTGAIGKYDFIKYCSSYVELGTRGVESPDIKVITFVILNSAA